MGRGRARARRCNTRVLAGTSRWVTHQPVRIVGFQLRRRPIRICARDWLSTFGDDQRVVDRSWTIRHDGNNRRSVVAICYAPCSGIGVRAVCWATVLPGPRRACWAVKPPSALPRASVIHRASFAIPTRRALVLSWVVGAFCAEVATFTSSIARGCRLPFVWVVFAVVPGAARARAITAA